MSAKAAKAYWYLPRIRHVADLNQYPADESQVIVVELKSLFAAAAAAACNR